MTGTDFCVNKPHMSRSYLNHLVHKQRTRKPWSEGTTDNSHTGHCTHTSESANVKYNSANAGTSDIGTININDRIAATLYSLGTWFVSGIYV